jgi:hypothetical protein
MVSDRAGALERRAKEHVATRDSAQPSLDDLHELLWQLDIVITEALTHLKNPDANSAREP